MFRLGAYGVALEDPMRQGAIAPLRLRSGQTLWPDQSVDVIRAADAVCSAPRAQHLREIERQFTVVYPQRLHSPSLRRG